MLRSITLKTLAGFLGGLAATAIMLLVFLAFYSLLQPVFSAEFLGKTSSPLIIWIIIGTLFIAVTLSSLLATGLIKYRWDKKASSHVAVMNLLIFIFMLPFYLTTGSLDLAHVETVAALHMFLSILTSFIIFELINNTRYALIALYSSIFALLLIGTLMFLLAQWTGSVSFLFLLILPIAWAGIGCIHGIISGLYQHLSREEDFLML